MLAFLVVACLILLKLLFIALDKEPEYKDDDDDEV